MAWFNGLLCLAILACWLFPRFWFTRADAHAPRFWLGEQTALPGWEYRPVPVGQAAERFLVADRLVNGEFTRSNGEVVRVFSAKRYGPHENDTGLFAHTPDRCWTEAGWRLEAATPSCVTVPVHGPVLLLERRVFSLGAQRELVYFGGLIGGQPLSYRLDHELSVALGRANNRSWDQTGTLLRVLDTRYWSRVRDAFHSRRPLFGPAQFVRLSTPVRGADVGAADRLLQGFLGEWLAPADYQKELLAWQSANR